MELHHFACQCQTPEHTIRFEYDPEDEELYVSVSLICNQTFFRRVIDGVRYIFGYRSRYGMFDCTLLCEEDLDRLEDLIRHAKNKRG